MTGVYKYIVPSIVAVVLLFSFVKVYSTLVSERKLKEKEISLIKEGNDLQQKIVETNVAISKKLETSLEEIKRESANNTEALNKLIASGKYENRCIDENVLRTLNERAAQ